jgi:membrane-associated protease RseP (regulator of RpoE activity)
MVSFYVYDIAFLIIFSLGVYLFLRSNKDSLSREGWMFMYRTQLGVKAMTWFDNKFHSLLGYLRYVIVSLGFVLMFVMIWMLGQTVWIYWSRPEIVEIIKAPPIAPLIPYFPELFGLQSMFPPFYFTYFLVALAVVAIVHEFSHGIFMRYSKTKIKSTGLVFLGPILGAFVEEDQGSFHSKDRFNQMSVLGAGVFANVLFALIFYLLYMGFFYVSFTSGGFVFNSYSVGMVNSSLVGDTFEVDNYTAFIVGGEKFFLDEAMSVQLEDGREVIVAYEDGLAFKAQLYGVIVGINDNKIRNQEDLTAVLGSYSPGDYVVIYTETQGEVLTFDLELGTHPLDENKAYLGVGYYGNQPKGFIQKILVSMVSFRTDSTYYVPTWNKDLVYFIYHLLWWVMIINLLVALFNMLPLGILDGGRFFYLAVEKFAGKNIAEKAYKWSGKLILFIFVLLMVIWLYRIL